MKYFNEIVNLQEVEDVIDDLQDAYDCKRINAQEYKRILNKLYTIDSELTPEEEKKLYPPIIFYHYSMQVVLTPHFQYRARQRSIRHRNILSSAVCIVESTDWQKAPFNKEIKIREIDRARELIYSIRKEKWARGIKLIFITLKKPNRYA